MDAKEDDRIEKVRKRDKEGTEARSGRYTTIVMGALMVIVIILFAYAHSTIDWTVQNKYSGGGKAKIRNVESPLEVECIADGDTFKLESGGWIRMLSINTEEKIRPYADQATRRLKEYLSMGNISLESDTEDMDHYGRYLRYVYVDTPEGKIHINLELVREGYAHAFIFENNQKYREEFFQAEAEAREAKRHIWQESTHNVVIESIQADEGDLGANGEYVVIRNNENATVNMSGWYLKDQSWHIYDFPDDFFLDANATVTIYTGAGRDNATMLYWDYPIRYRDSSTSHRAWNDGGEVAFLRTGAYYKPGSAFMGGGELVDFYEYGNRIQ